MLHHIRGAALRVVLPWYRKFQCRCVGVDYLSSTTQIKNRDWDEYSILHVTYSVFNLRILFFRL